MVATVRQLDDKSPEKNYTIALCDACGEECPESKVPGRKRGIAPFNAAVAAALRAGWTQRVEAEKRPRSIVTILRLLCPACLAERS
ncbi:MAG: hypothetical protein JWN86_712 [Planctomycetota bacterium]|nr:hypothetical protein [Planctomycetota bacterium]